MQRITPPEKKHWSKHTDCYEAVGRQMAKGKLHSAKKHIEYVIAKQMKEAQRIFDCGLNLLAKGEVEDALEDFRKVWHCNSAVINIRLYSGLMILRFDDLDSKNKTDMRKLRALIEEAAKYSGNPGLLCQVVIAQLATGNTESARMSMAALLKYEPASIPSYLHRDYILLLLDKHLIMRVKPEDVNNAERMQQQLASIIINLQDPIVYFNASLLVMCPQTTLGSIFSFPKQFFYFFTATQSMLDGHKGTVLAELNRNIADMLPKHMFLQTYLALSQLCCEPAFVEELRQKLPAVYRHLIQKPQARMQSEEEGNRYIDNLNL